MKAWPIWIASVLGIGYFPFASGTVASAAALLPWLWLPRQPGLYAVSLIAVILIGIWSADQAEKILQEKDSHKIVIDEVAGMWIAAAYLPLHWGYVLAAFLLFRLFDVWKPLGIRQSQALPGGWGIMVDDVLAGVLANACLQVFHLLTAG